MTLHLWFRDKIEHREEIQWPSAPMEFRKPWLLPISVVQMHDEIVPDKPIMKSITYHRVNIIGDDAYYYATFKDIS